ncbi:MAG: endonuclease/exonuclease/phosphatase family protein [Bacteroidetes bacterium]|nr:endonuclease/exonuclease/phosphatase family protein [Bacteroidota bacterium]
MKRVLFYFLSSLFLFLAGCSVPPPGTHVMTYNIRLNIASDSTNAWPNRRNEVFSLIRFHNPDIIGLQEVLPDQRVDLEALNDVYLFEGSGREDGFMKGEATVIGLRKERYSVKETGHFFLSETPDIPSLGWDAAWIRPTIWIKALDKSTEKIILVVNTHLDNMGHQARINGSRQIAGFISKQSGIHSVVVTGDFNTNLESGELDSLNSAYLKPAQAKLNSPAYGPNWSFQGFGSVPIQERQLIDFIFLSEGWTVVRLGVLTDRMTEKWPSDHCPVLVELK